MPPTIDNRLVIESHPLPPENTQLTTLDTLERRIKHLEGALASFQDTSQMEERVAQRVAKIVVLQSPTALELSAAEHVRNPVPPHADHPFEGTSVREALEHAAKQRWLLIDLYDEIRAMVWMFLDRRYRVTWTALIFPLTALICLCLSWLTIGNIPLIGPLLDKLFDVVMVVVAYKVLSREASRYVETVGHSFPRPRS